jgi:hypothetical protein
MADIRITPAASVMAFTSSLNFKETLTQEASGSLTLLGSGSTGRTDLFTVNGNNGTLFSVSDDLSNSLFSVNTIAGLPVIEAFADNTVVMGTYGSPGITVNGSTASVTGSLLGTASYADMALTASYALTVNDSSLKGVHNILGYTPQASWGTTAMTNCSGNSFTTQTGNSLILYPFIPNKTITSVSLKIQVGTAVPGGIARILIYSNLDGFPNAKLYESANLDCSTTGIKSATTSFTFTAGTTYWLAAHTNDSIFMVSHPVANLIPIGFDGMGGGITSYTSLSVSIGSAPDPYVFQYVNGSAVTAIFISLS